MRCKLDVGGLGDREARGLFNSARDAAYAEIANELRSVAVELNRDAAGEAKTEVGR